jgi:hypothetical protein
MKINQKNSFKIPPLLSPEWIEIKPLFYNLFICGVPLTSLPNVRFKTITNSFKSIPSKQAEGVSIRESPEAKKCHPLSSLNSKQSIIKKDERDE